MKNLVFGLTLFFAGCSSFSENRPVSVRLTDDQRASNNLWWRIPLTHQSNDSDNPWNLFVPARDDEESDFIRRCEEEQLLEMRGDRQAVFGPNGLDDLDLRRIY